MWLLFCLLNPSVDAFTLRDVIRSTEKSFPMMRAADAETSVATGRLQTSEGEFDVRVRGNGSRVFGDQYNTGRFDALVEKPTSIWGASLFAGYRSSTGTFPPYYGLSDAPAPGQMRAGVNVPIIRDGPTDKRRTGLAQAEIGQDAAVQFSAQQKIEIRKDATILYWEWLAAVKRLEVYEGLLQVAKERGEQLEKQVKRGDLPRFDVDDNQRAILQRESQMVAAERSLQEASYRLGLYLRDEQGAPRVVARSEGVEPLALPSDIEHAPYGPLPRTELKVNEKAAIMMRPDVIRLRARKQQVELDAALAKNQTLPRLDLQVGAVRNMASGLYAKFGNGFEVGAGIEIPLQVNVAEGQGQSARAILIQIEAQEELLMQRVEQELRDILSALEQSRKRVELATLEYKTAHDLELGERKRFKLGSSNLIFVNLREQQTSEAMVRQINSKIDYLRALARYDAAIATKYEYLN
jgi:outer membrane protein, heavy metal efflux system